MGRKWCQIEPTVSVNGKSVEIYCAVLADPDTVATMFLGAPTDVEVRVPPGSTHVRTDATDGIAGEGFNVTFVEDGTCDVTAAGPRVKAKMQTHMVPTDPATGKPFPVNLLVDPVAPGNGSAQVSGYANGWTPTASVRA